MLCPSSSSFKIWTFCKIVCSHYRMMKCAETRATHSLKWAPFKGTSWFQTASLLEGKGERFRNSWLIRNSGSLITGNNLCYASLNGLPDWQLDNQRHRDQQLGTRQSNTRDLIVGLRAPLMAAAAQLFEKDIIRSWNIKTYMYIRIFLTPHSQDWLLIHAHILSLECRIYLNFYHSLC